MTQPAKRLHVLSELTHTESLSVLQNLIETFEKQNLPEIAGPLQSVKRNYMSLLGEELTANRHCPEFES